MNAAGVASGGFKDDVLVTFRGDGDTAAFYAVVVSFHIGDNRMNKHIEHTQHKCCKYYIRGCCFKLIKEFL
nr:MAG TPA: hypothetical protein [Caudoviricetes sp.]